MNTFLRVSFISTFTHSNSSNSSIVQILFVPFVMYNIKNEIQFKYEDNVLMLHNQYCSLLKIFIKIEFLIHAFGVQRSLVNL